MITVLNIHFGSAADPQLARVTHPIPQFFDQATSPYIEANRYLRVASRRLAYKSVQTNAEHIKEFLGWLRNSGLDTVDVTDEIFDCYVDVLCAYKNKSGKPLSWNTVNSRIGGAHRYLLWCYSEGFCPSLAPVEMTSCFRSARKRYQVKGHPARQMKEPVNFLLLEAAISFVDALALDRRGQAGRYAARNKLIGALMLQSGLRISEVSNFPLSDLPELNHEGHSTAARVIGKGGKRRVVLIPNKLLVKIWEYVDIDREVLCERLKARDPDLFVSNTLFISKAGKSVTVNWIEKMFTTASKRLGIKTIPHALRHTYATYHYLLNKDLAGLANLLGHASETITRTYYVSTAVPISYAGSFSGLQDEIDFMISKTGIE